MRKSAQTKRPPTARETRNLWRRFVVNTAEARVILAGYDAVRPEKERDGRPYRMMTYLRDRILSAAKADAGI